MLVVPCDRRMTATTRLLLGQLHYRMTFRAPAVFTTIVVIVVLIVVVTVQEKI
jgi:hypothetical protein